MREYGTVDGGPGAVTDAVTDAVIDAVIDAVVLDVGGVFLIPHPEPLAAVLAAHGITIDPALIERAHYTGTGALDICVEPDGHFDCYLAALAGALGVPADQVARATEILVAHWATPEAARWSWHVPGSREALRELVEAGHTVAILSNADGTVEAQLREQGICQVGEGDGAQVVCIADSTIVGIAKPDPRIFYHVAEAIGVQPERCLYVGDTVRFDVIGARAAGFHPYHFDPHDLCGSTDVHPHVRSLTEIAALARATRRAVE
jgi:putative hydrolase of the HAD superfamily